ncbi:hypothetical protein ONA23_05190 [Mycoplasmopsis cynos]|uniref:hypothetical protein n=1 Tax=Mycoplasmopsis cynos TaxID=171284 RepID=UPI00220FB8C8|nr:hypothetical protein [Mycoplasmopsis cynos]MCU9936383.1 hypothetical protein [Mycoplasmopsis cynos]UWV82588.1 hypothetical protein NW067_06620 [Mycoplasmopsis cynos]UWV93878.1 hypothetical protein NW062_00855 [Mycoplasmopsis cynos]WAM06356.1 hypothetical protein ONA23_05190 [Mycoplasmopsis cynos]
MLEYIGVEDVTLATIQGFEPYQGLPENVMVIDSLGNKNVKSVKWEPFKENEFDKIGLIVKEGTIEGTNLKAKAHIRIASKDISKSINISKQVTGFNYPAAFASFTNDIDKDQMIEFQK